MMKTAFFTFLLLSAVAAFAQTAPKDVPDSLKPPPNEKLILVAHASGVQIYACTKTEGPFVWKLKAPEAELRDDDGHMVIQHGAGPSWQHKDGSRVTGKPAANVPSPDPGSIPWLLVATDNSQSNPGLLSTVTHIQRIHTQGGAAPKDGCDGANAGNEVRVKYTADYLFYAAK